jgi:hypothetical protein
MSRNIEQSKTMKISYSTTALAAECELHLAEAVIITQAIEAFPRLCRSNSILFAGGKKRKGVRS